jgi:hypothetical protein
MRINIEALMARGYAATYPWVGRISTAGRLPGVSFWMPWPVGDEP